MERTLKIFSSGTDQDRLAAELAVIERYQGFLLARVSEKQVSDLASRYPVEDITEQFRIPTHEGFIDTDQPRLDARGRVRSHPFYRGIKRLSAGPHHYLVQFQGPIKAEWLAGIEQAGGKLQAPQAGFSYVVRADDETATRIAALPYVRWTGHLNHGERLAPSLLGWIRRKVGEVGGELPRTRILPGVYTVEFFDAETLEAAVSAVQELGFDLLEKTPGARVMVLSAPPGTRDLASRIRGLSAVHGVRIVRERALKRTSNDVAARILGTQTTLGAAGLALDGEGEIVAVCDTGLDTGDPATVHRDFAGRVAWIKSYPIGAGYSRYIDNPGGNDGAADLDSGHGTHVAGSVLGDGSGSQGLAGLEGPIRGLAFRARLVFQAVEQEMKWKDPADFGRYGRYLLTGIPSDLTSLFGDAYAQGARIHSNSWGGGDPGAYDEQCEQLDRFVWEHKDFCVLVAAGNDGTDKDADGKINPISVTSPGTAKNCICVGACENERPGFSRETYGRWWSDDYPVAPFRDDPMANDPGHMAAFSSRGPTQDGRIRPDLVAPGTFILSTRSTRIGSNNSAWGAFPSSRLYFHMGGTSMATPLAAGAATLVRQYLRRDRGIGSPSAALIKASLAAGARRLPGVGEPGLLADNDQGVGRIDLDRVLAPAAPSRAEFVDIRPGLGTGEVWTRQIDVHSSDASLRVVMAYSDYPGDSLVNNLNLIVSGPDGRRHVGNQRGESALSMDGKNNLELAEIAAPVPGPWKVEVVGSNVPRSPQDFALVMLGPLGAPAESALVRAERFPDKAIPDADPGGISDTIELSHAGTVAATAVELDVRHSYIGDLRVMLAAPDGTRVTLHDREGASRRDLRKTYDLSSTAGLSALAGRPITGTWRLAVSDHAKRDTGTLRGWVLTITPVPGDEVEAESTPGLAIPDNDARGIEDSVGLSGGGKVRGIEVSVDITHTWIGDLSVVLRGPSGTDATLHGRTGGGKDNLIETFDSASLPALKAFEGQSLEGLWTLAVSDHAGRDVGKLNRWGLRIRR